MEHERSRVLLIYTGGTIGMAPTGEGLAPSPGYLEEKVNGMDEINTNANIPLCDILRWDELIDSSNMDPSLWALLAAQIEKYYFQYDGFVVLHGTDTMAYTASALSFMLEHLGKPVVLTGSQIPFCELYNDARRNLLVATIFAGMCEIPEVCIFFDTQLLRGNRCQKIDSEGLQAFDSPNFPPLATLRNEIRIRYDLVRKQPKQRLRVHTRMSAKIAVLHLVPGFDDEIFLRLAGSGIRGLILNLYGTGNAPTKKASFLKAIESILDAGIAVVAVSQCSRGKVNMGTYEVGRRMQDLGVLNGGDMTMEAASTKLGYLIARGLSPETFSSAMQNSLRGELTVKGDDFDGRNPFLKNADLWHNL
mmetsp:Transcript_23816/g.44486  ORF Transcript_23816/g.44486 Transcript_23816/m.44486 type:complete len:362 (-) Transcript_23816:295-1380(-)